MMKEQRLNNYKIKHHKCNNSFQTMNNMKQRTVIPEGKKTSGEPHHCLSSLPGESFEATVQEGETELEPNGLLG